MFELSITQAAFFGFGFTLVGALVGALATVFAARLVAERQQLYAESAKFRAEFVEEIINLRSVKDDAFRILAPEVIVRHRGAKVLFEPWVSGRNLSAFNKAWEVYESSGKTRSPGSLDNRKAECERALGQLEHLLSFARHRG